MPRRWLFFPRMRDRRCIVSLAGALLLLGTVSSKAELRISGQRDSLTVEAQDTTLRDILEALHRRFAFEYHARAHLEQTVTGTYAGSLQHVLSRVLAGRDYTMRLSSRGVDVVLFDESRSGRPTSSKSFRSAASGRWKDGDGNLVSPPSGRMARFADAEAPTTWRDGDGNLIAQPTVAMERVKRFAAPDAPATWRDGDGNLIAPPVRR